MGEEIKTAVIPSAGYGTRLLPVTKIIQKAVLPLGTVPILSEVLWEAYNAGINRAIIITHWRENTIMDLIKIEAQELEDWLEKRGRRDLVDIMKKIVPPMEIEFVRQEVLNGLGGAILLAEKYVEEDFCVLLPDNILFEERRGDTVRKMLRVFLRARPETLLCVSRVDKTIVDRFGIIAYAREDTVNGEKVYVVRDLIEKPKPEEAPSNLAIVGRYIFTTEIFDYLKGAPMVGMEIDETQAFKAQVMDGKKVYALDLGDIKWFDVGKIDGYFKAFVLHVARTEGMGRVKEWLMEILGKLS